jgi:hypothetical protein
VRLVGERPQLVRRVERAELRRLRDGHHAGLHDVLVAEPHELRGDEVRGELAVRRGDGEELEAAHPLGRAALVDVEVRALRADDALPWPQHRPQRDDVRRGAVEDEERLGVGAELVAQALAGARRHVVGAVGGRVPVVDGGDRGHDLGEDGGVVVRVEVGAHRARR